MARGIRCIVNDSDVRATMPPGTLVLDFLRRQRKLTDVKEGCREGDCGACTVLIGTLENQGVSYKPVTSCLMPVAELHGKHLVTVEGLNLERLSPVQQAIVDEGASQCGFCTPGIVVSLTALLMQDGAEISPNSTKEALSGHLCRCTGYRSLKAVADRLAQTVGSRTGVAALVTAGALPAYFLEIPQRLQKIPAPAFAESKKAHALPVAGGTDLYVQAGEKLPETDVVALNLLQELRGISTRNGRVHVGALTTFEDFLQHPHINAILPEIRAYMFLIASYQIRNRATLGGNIINASPIADMTILFLALRADLVLQEGEKTRRIPLAAFYKGYKQIDKTPSELLTEIVLAVPSDDTEINFEKVSKRTALDIASVNSAICIQCEDDAIRDIGLAFGGVAPIPLYMRQTAQFLAGKPLTKESVIGAMHVAQAEISPISDIRGSEAYKRLLVRQLLIAHFTKLFPERFNVEDFYEAHR